MISFPLAALFSRPCELLFQYISLSSRKRILSISPTLSSTSTTAISDTTSYIFNSTSQETTSSSSSSQLPIAMVQPQPEAPAGDNINNTSGCLSGIQHKHRCKDKDKAKRHQLVCDRVNAWIPDNSTMQGDVKVSCSMLKDYMQIIKDIVHMEGYHYKRNLLVPTLIYADKYVQKCGPVADMRDAFLLLLISAMVTVKMWEDWGISSGVVEEFVGISRKQLREMERKFLAALDYSLFLSEEEIQQFKERTPDVLDLAVSVF